MIKGVPRQEFRERRLRGRLFNLMEFSYPSMLVSEQAAP